MGVVEDQGAATSIKPSRFSSRISTEAEAAAIARRRRRERRRAKARTPGFTRGWAPAARRAAEDRLSLWRNPTV